MNTILVNLLFSIHRKKSLRILYLLNLFLPFSCLLCCKIKHAVVHNVGARWSPCSRSTQPRPRRRHSPSPRHTGNCRGCTPRPGTSTTPWGTLWEEEAKGLDKSFIICSLTISSHSSLAPSLTYTMHVVFSTSVLFADLIISSLF